MTIEDIKNKLKEKGRAVFHVKVSPGADKTEWQKTLDDGMLRMKVKEAPERGRANESVINFLADFFETKKKSVSIIAGGGARIKRIKIVKR